MAYTCPECGKDLADFAELERHTESVHARDIAGGVVPVADDPDGDAAYGFDSQDAASETEHVEQAVLEAAGSAEREALEAVHDRSADSGAAGTNVDAATQSRTGPGPAPVRQSPNAVVIAALVIIAATGVLVAILIGGTVGS